MRRSLLVLVLLSGSAAARPHQSAPASRPTLAPITENYQSPKMTRLRQLNAMLADAMAATPTVDQIQDAQAELKAIDVMTKIAAQVKGEIADDHLRPNGAVAFSVVQDNLRMVEARLDFVKRMHKATVALSVLAGVADAHGESSDAQKRAAIGALSSLSDMRGAAPDLYDAMVAWHDQLDGKLAQVMWPDDAPTIELSRKALAAAPIPVHVAVDGTRWKPVAIVNVTGPLHELRVVGTGASVRIRGPVTNDHGVVSGPKDGADWKSLDVGTYVLEAQGDGRPETLDVVLVGPETPIDPFLQVGTFVADVPLQNRHVDAAYPFLAEVHAAWERQKLFATAPRGLFVYARDDLDKQDAEAWGQNSDAMPRKDEPLLVTYGPHGSGLVVFDAEGFAWSLHDWKMLAVAPSGAPALPEKIHPLELDFSPDMFGDHAQPQFASFAPGTVDAIVKPYLKTVATWKACTNKVLQSYGGAATNDYDLVTYEHGHVKKVEAMSEVAWQAADRKCGTKAYEKKLQAFDKQLSDAHNRQRAKALEEIRAAWAK
jgi:hypothetical protein